MTEPTTKPRRRFAISLRSLMILVLVIGGFLGWQARRATIQRQAVAKITAAGGTVQYDYQNGVGAGGQRIFRRNAQPWAPEWIRKPIGDEYFQEASYVFLQSMNPNAKIEHDPTLYEAVAMLDRVESVNTLRYPLEDRDFARLMAMPRLKEVCSLDIDVTDAGLESVASAPAIESLILRSNQPGSITGRCLEALARQPRLKRIALISVNPFAAADLAPLAKLTKLEFLQLDKSPQDDACLAPLLNLTKLQSLWLSQTQITDEGADRLAGLGQLETLAMDGSKLTDVGLAKIASHTRLRTLVLWPAPNLTDESLAQIGRLGLLSRLELTNSKFSDLGLEHLKNLTLESLAVSGEGVTDVGLATLQQIPSLRYLSVVGTKITAKGRAAFRKARPGVFFEGGPSEPDPED